MSNKPFNPYGTAAGIFIPYAVVQCKELSSTAKMLYGHYLRRAGKDGRCWPSKGDCAASLAIDERSVKRTSAELEAFGLIQRMPQYRKDGSQSSNAIEFLRHPILDPDLEPLPDTEGGGDTIEKTGEANLSPSRDAECPPSSLGGHTMSPLEVSKDKTHRSENLCLEDLAERLCKAHPRKGDRTLAETILCSVVAESVEPSATAAQVGAAHAAWLKHWSGIETRYVPKLSRWLQDGGWRDLPPISVEPATAQANTDWLDDDDFVKRQQAKVKRSAGG